MGLQRPSPRRDRADRADPSPDGGSRRHGCQLATRGLHSTLERRGRGERAEMRDAVQAFLGGDLGADVPLRPPELVAIGAVDLLDDAAVERLTTRWGDQARESGALARLAGGLAFHSAFVDAPSGRLAAAWTADAEARELGEVTHNAAIVPPTGAHRVITLALSG